MRVIVIPADLAEDIREVDAPEEGQEFSTWMHELFQGDFELHKPANFRRSNLCLWFGAEAKFQSESPNPRATLMATINPSDYIAGPVVITGEKHGKVVEAPASLDMINLIVNATMKYKKPRR